jgi:hypothetical protein
MKLTLKQKLLFNIILTFAILIGMVILGIVAVEYLLYKQFTRSKNVQCVESFLLG